MYVGHNMFVCVICVYCVCESRQSMGMQICFAPAPNHHMFKFFIARAVTTVLIGSSTVILVCLSLLVCISQDIRFPFARTRQNILRQTKPIN